MRLSAAFISHRFMDDYVRDVVSAIKQIDPDYVVPMRRSGEQFYEAIKRSRRRSSCALSRALKSLSIVIVSRVALRATAKTEWRASV
jgi:hypothetical protein